MATELKLQRRGGDVVCDSELFEHLMDMAEILDMYIRGVEYAPKEINRIGRQVRQLRNRYDDIVVGYYADSWDTDETTDPTPLND